MFIDQTLKTARRCSEGRNETRLVLSKLSSAPPNRAGGVSDRRAISMSLERQAKLGVSY